MINQKSANFELITLTSHAVEKLGYFRTIFRVELRITWRGYHNQIVHIGIQTPALTGEKCSSDTFTGKENSVLYVCATVYNTNLEFIQVVFFLV